MSDPTSPALPGLSIREATAIDAAAIVALVAELAASMGEESPLTPAYAKEFVQRPGCVVLLAERHGHALGLLSLTLRPNLYHAADCCQIEELVVAAAARGQGIGGALVRAAVERATRAGCAEISVSTLLDNAAAQRLYRAHGLTDESLLLERHL